MRLSIPKLDEPSAATFLCAIPHASDNVLTYPIIIITPSASYPQPNPPRPHILPDKPAVDNVDMTKTASHQADTLVY